MRLQPVAETAPLTEAERVGLRALWLNDALRVGAVLELAGRRLIVRGFDPVSVSGNRIYLEDALSRTRFAVSAEDVLR